MWICLLGWVLLNHIFFGPFCAYASTLKGYDDMILGFMLGYMMLCYARCMLGFIMWDRRMIRICGVMWWHDDSGMLGLCYATLDECYDMSWLDAC